MAPAQEYAVKKADAFGLTTSQAFAKIAESAESQQISVEMNNNCKFKIGKSSA